MKVGFFDSGLGGLSVLNEALKRFSGYEFVYYADTKNVPYGTKSVKEIIKFSTDACEFLLSLGVETIVIACNTATSAAIKELRAKFNLPIIGMEPAIKTALEKFKDQKTLLLATPATINGIKLKELMCNLNSKNLVTGVALPDLVKYAENMEFDTKNIKNYLKNEFSGLNLDEFASIVLGCTHFNYFKDSLREILPTAKFIDGIDGTLNRLKSLNLKPKKDGIRYFYSKNEVVNENEKLRIDKFLTRLDKMRNIT